ncbi:hypothetical protein [Agromyces sp. M3QZ16-3]|uniref:hypothetical protein n=1 Tax=Agromyces sp. M3QZ16-3 TaxID=3447585 RepID=UPI003F693CC2
MKTTYRVFAWIIAALVAVQAAAIVFAVSGMFSYIDAGGVIDASLSQDAIPEGAGIGIHAMVGAMILPVIALVLLVLSFFTRNGRAIWMAAALLVLVLVQVLLGFSGWSSPAAGAAHGANALLIFGVALAAGLGLGLDRGRRQPAPATEAAEAAPAPTTGA